MAEPSPGSDDYGSSLIDFSAIRGFIWRQRFVLAGVIGVALLLGFIATLLTQPIYQATASVRVDPAGNNNIVEGQDLQSSYFSYADVDRHLQTLAEVLKSRAMAYMVVDSLKLDSRAEFFGKEAVEKIPEGMTAKQWQAKRREIAASIVQGSVSVEVPLDSGIISISFRSEQPAFAASVANTFVDNFLTDDIRRSIEANSYAQKYLEQQIAKTRLSLQDAERDAIAYAKANRIVTQAMTSASASGNPSGGSTGTIVGATLASVNDSLTQARTARIEAEQRWRAVAQLPAAQLPEVLQSQTVQLLSTERAKLIGRLSDLRQRYGETYPDIVELKAQVSALDREIAKTSADIKSTLQNAYQIALKQEVALSAELKGAADQTLDEQDRRVQFGILDREAQALRQQLASLLDRYNQISSAANLRSGNITRLDTAVAPNSPISPHLTKNLMVALVLGFGLAVGLALLRDLLDDRLRSAEEVERKLGMKLLGVTPLVDDVNEIEDHGPLNEAYSSIRTSIGFALPRLDHNIVVLTSSMPSEGKTLTATVLAKKYAQLGRKVLLVDSDLRKPSIANYFGVRRSEQGFVEVLLGNCSLESALIDQPQKNLDVLPVGTIPHNPVDVLSSPLLKDFLDKYSQVYSLIVIDSPPIMGLADAPLLAHLADGVVYVVESNRAYFGQAKTALRRLRDAQANVLGVVLTKFRAIESGQAYDYHYTYYTYGDEGKSQ